jgi:hypothetical protein
MTGEGKSRPFFCLRCVETEGDDSGKRQCGSRCPSFVCLSVKTAQGGLQPPAGHVAWRMNERSFVISQ